MFSKRLLQPELLDHLPPEEARPNLADLVRINTHLGGHSTIRRSVERVFPAGDAFTVLDVGSASGDTARMLQRLFPNAAITSLDYNSTNIEQAPAPKLIADAFALPFGPESFDFVISTLFTHHFTNQQVTALLGAFYAVARRAVIVIDLERHPLPYLFLPASSLYFRWHRITVHDGLISIRASFKAEEMRALAQAAGIRKISMQRFRPAFRIAMICHKR